MPRPGAEGWIGPVHSPLREDRNPSFSYRLDSETDPGAWTDHATGEHGSMADLAQRLGIDPRQTEPRNGERLPSLQPVTGPELTLEEFCRRRRLDSDLLTTRWRVRESSFKGRPALQFPSHLGIDRVKYLDGERPKAGWATAGGRPHWYGLRAARELGGDALFLVNGEVSVWACAQAGVPAVCLAAGEGTVPDPDLVSELRKTGISRMRVVYDLDRAGRQGARRVVDALVSGGIDAVALELPVELGDGGDVDDLHRRTGDEGLSAALAKLPKLPPDLAVEELPLPDLAVLGGYRRAAPVFPLDLMGSWADWINAAAEGAGAPPDYVACGLLAVAGAAIGNARQVSPWPGWTEPSVLWIGLVGEPSSGKSPALDPILRAVARVEARWAGPWEDEHRAWKASCVVAKVAADEWERSLHAAIRAGKEAPPAPEAADQPEEPVRPRLRVADVTPEALAEVLAGNPRGLLLMRDELAAWLGSMGRYTGAACGERGLWLEAFGARPHTIDRVKTGAVTIPHLAVSILGTTQPQRLHDILLSKDDDGLAARFLWTWPEPLPPTRPQRCADVERLELALGWLRDLTTCDAEPVTLDLAPDAADLFEEWRREHSEAQAGTAGMLASAFGKAPGLVLRLAIVLELLEAAGSVAPAPGLVSRVSFVRAAALWEDYFAPMAERVFGDAALPEADRHAATLARWLVKARPGVVNARELYRRVRLPGLAEAGPAKAALESLVEAGWLTAPAPDGRGRPRTDYRVRPELWAALDGGRRG
jgi:hypothetical protein